MIEISIENELHLILQPLNHQLVEALFLLDEMCGFVDTGHQLVQSGCPIVENLFLILLLGEVNDAGWSVDLHFQSSTVDELSEKLFGFRFIEVQQFCHA